MDISKFPMDSVEKSGWSRAEQQGETPHWYAIRMKPGRDEMAMRGLDRMELETFRPFMRVEVESTRGGRFRRAPLFHGYVFARFVANDSLELVRYVHGVLHVVSSGRTPLAVEDEIIAEIRSRLGPDGLFQLHRKKFAVNDRVVIQDGPLAGLIGRVAEEWDDGRRVALLLEALHDARVVVDPGVLAAS